MSDMEPQTFRTSTPFCAGILLTLQAHEHVRAGDDASAALTQKVAKDALELGGISPECAANTVAALQTGLGIANLKRESGVEHLGNRAASSRDTSGQQVGAMINLQPDGSIQLIAGQTNNASFPPAAAQVQRAAAAPRRALKNKSVCGHPNSHATGTWCLLKPGHEGLCDWDSLDLNRRKRACRRSHPPHAHAYNSGI